MNEAPLPKPAPNRAARQAAVRAHANAMTSGNPRLAKTASAKLTKLNMAPAHQPKFNQAKFNAKIGRQIDRASLPSSGNKNLIPATRGGIGGRGKQAPNQVPFVAESLTGYKEIEHIRQHPIAGGLALAGLLPIGKVGKLGELAAKGIQAANAGRTAEEAATHAAEAAAEAKARGFGSIALKPHEAPRVPPGETTPGTGGELGAQVRQGLKGAGTARNQNALLYSAERAKRAARATEAMKIGGQAGYHAALGTLKGELPKVDFQGFKQLDQHTLDAMHTFIQQHPSLRPYEKIRAMGSLQGAVRGKVPTASEQKILQRVFGADTTQKIVDSVPFWKKAKNLGLELLNVPRAIMASFDLSAPFRQGLMAGMAHPGIFAKNLAPMLRSFKSEHFYQGVMNGIYEHPLFPLAQKGKLAITDIGLDPHGAPLANREEQFMSNLAERIPGIGHIIRASDRAYTGFLNKDRMDTFAHLIQQAAENGLNLHDQKVVEDIAKFVNSATGRGDLGAFQKHAVTLNTLLFSPRLLWSRLNFLNPHYYYTLDPFARAQALRAARNLVISMAVVLEAAKRAGAQVSTDPTNADFGKIKIGNTRIDLAGGFQQPVRLIAQLIEGKITSSTTGKVIHLGPQGVGHLSRKDIAQRFVEGKLAPVPSAINDLMSGTTFGGQKLNPSSEIGTRLTPLVWQDLYGIAANGPPWNAHIATGSGQGPEMAALLAIPDLLGIGVQNYSAKKKKGSGGSSPFGGYGGGSSGDFGGYGGSGSSGFGGYP